MRRLLLLIPLGVVVAVFARSRSDEGTARAFAVAAEPDGTPFGACIEALVPAEEDTVRRQLTNKYRLSPDDAHDLVRDALVSVCARHAVRPYERLAAALQTAAENRARDGWRHSRRYLACPLDDQMPTCAPSPDETTRLRDEDRVVAAALCKEDRVSERIIRQRIVEEMDFASIGNELGLTADQTRTMFHNALRRVQRRVAEACRL